MYLCVDMCVHGWENSSAEVKFVCITLRVMDVVGV